MIDSLNLNRMSFRYCLLERNYYFEIKFLPSDCNMSEMSVVWISDALHFKGGGNNVYKSSLGPEN